MKAPENTSVQDVIKRMDEQYQKYRFMEANLVHKKRRCIIVCAHVCVCVLCPCVGGWVCRWVGVGVPECVGVGVPVCVSVGLGVCWCAQVCVGVGVPVGGCACGCVCGCADV